MRVASTVSVVCSMALYLGAFGAAAQTLAFKGLELGASEPELLKHYPSARCSGEAVKRTCSILRDASADARILRDCRERGESTESCAEKMRQEWVTVAGAVIRFATFRFYDGRLGQIYLSTSPSAFDGVTAAFTEVHGKAASDESSTVSNRAGATFENRELIWTLPGGMIRLKKYTGRLDRSSVLYLSPEGIAATKSEFEQQRKKAARDL